MMKGLAIFGGGLVLYFFRHRDPGMTAGEVLARSSP